MILHDVADPLMEVAKLFLYHKNQRMADTFFVTFSAVFIFTRDFVYTKRIIWFLFQHKHKYDYIMKDFFFGLLSFLQVLQWIWTVMIVKMLFCAVINKRASDDIREKDE